MSISQIYSTLNALQNEINNIPAGPTGPTGPAGNNGINGSTGPTGPIGPTGPSGSSVGSGDAQSIVYMPGGSSASGSTFLDFASLCTYAATLNQNQVVSIYLSPVGLATYPKISINIAAGVYNLPPYVKFIGSQSSHYENNEFVELNFNADVVLNGTIELSFINCNVSYNNTSSSLSQRTGNSYVFLENCLFSSNGAVSAFYLPSGSATAYFYLKGQSSLNYNGAAVIQPTAFNSAIIYAYDQSNISANALSSDEVFNIYAESGATIDSSYSSSVTLINNSKNVIYTPANSSNWTTFSGSVPANVAAALDLIAAKLAS